MWGLVEPLALLSLWAKGNSCCRFRNILPLVWAVSQKVTPKKNLQKAIPIFLLDPVPWKNSCILIFVPPPSLSHRSFMLHSGGYIIPIRPIELTWSCLQGLKPHKHLEISAPGGMENEMGKPEKWQESFWEGVRGKEEQQIEDDDGFSKLLIKLYAAKLHNPSLLSWYRFTG